MLKSGEVDLPQSTLLHYRVNLRPLELGVVASEVLEAGPDALLLKSLDHCSG